MLGGTFADSFLLQFTRRTLTWKRRSCATLISLANTGYVTLSFLLLFAFPSHWSYAVSRQGNMLTPFQPCVGIARLKRWRRANMLKLNPPIEVLAVLLKDQNVSERAHMDELLS